MGRCIRISRFVCDSASSFAQLASARCISRVWSRGSRQDGSRKSGLAAVAKTGLAAVAKTGLAGLVSRRWSRGSRHDGSRKAGLAGAATTGVERLVSREPPRRGSKGWSRKAGLAGLVARRWSNAARIVSRGRSRSRSAQLVSVGGSRRWCRPVASSPVASSPGCFAPRAPCLASARQNATFSLGWPMVFRARAFVSQAGAWRRWLWTAPRRSLTAFAFRGYRPCRQVASIAAHADEPKTKGVRRASNAASSVNACLAFVSIPRSSRACPPGILSVPYFLRRRAHRASHPSPR